MTPTREQLAAFADGQLEGDEARLVSAAVAADPALQAEVAAHRALRARLAAHFAPVAEESLPTSLAALLSATAVAPVIDLAAVRTQRRGVPRWTWIAAPALAASLVLTLVLNKPAGPDPGYADTQLAGALDSQLVADQRPNARVRVLLSFRDRAGAYCRAFSGAGASGIACRDQRGWRLRQIGNASEAQSASYRQAGSDLALMQAAQAIAIGPALDSTEERTARARGWRQQGIE